MLDGLRILGACLGAFMAIAVISPQSEPPTAVESIFVGIFTLTGVILLLPFKKITKYIRGVVVAYILTFFSSLSLLFHCLVLIESGTSTTSFLTIILVFYPLILVNIYWYFKNAKL